LHHHEAFDGTGYPMHLTGDAIPLSARILAVVDAWDAMTSNRPYRSGMSPDQATSILINGSGFEWDPMCVTAFMKCEDAVRIRMDMAKKPDKHPRLARLIFSE
jgi:HD-GYP domain-containing protein (c-di-GMP phosphodiesterase class II)